MTSTSRFIPRAFLPARNLGGGVLRPAHFLFHETRDHARGDFADQNKFVIQNPRQRLVRGCGENVRLAPALSAKGGTAPASSPQVCRPDFLYADVHAANQTRIAGVVL